VLLNLGNAAALDEATWGDGVRLVSATYRGRWELPVIGEVPGAAAVLIRPDGHVAWAGELADDGMRRALREWFGA
jgi:3-(3-hydroxy-phenyl)propionate hydroxylase